MASLVARILRRLPCACSKHDTQIESANLSEIQSDNRPDTESPTEQPFGIHWLKEFDLKTLSTATNNFDPSHQIYPPGSSAFGVSYWGLLGSDEIVALVTGEEMTARDWKLFCFAITPLSGVHHANICGMIGYCREGGKKILVHPHAPGGRLYDRLHSPIEDRARRTPGASGEGKGRIGNRVSPHCPLTLEERVVVALQIAKALRYLHHEVDVPFLHRDVKSSNVLLGEGGGTKLKAFLTFFGLEIVMPVDIAGTFGYMAPECMREGRMVHGGDVYAFGVLLLELLTGRKATSRDPVEDGMRTLVDEMHNHLAAIATVDLKEIVDPSIRGEMDNVVMMEMARDMLRVAADCVNPDRELRKNSNMAAHNIEMILRKAGITLE